MENKLLAILFRHGTNDSSVWEPQIPSDDPDLLALTEKYADSGCSSRGTDAEMLGEVRDLLNPEPVRLHIIMYADPKTAYVGTDVFSTFEAAVRQFDTRYAETLEEHGGDPDRFTFYERDLENRELCFVDEDGYEVFYRTEILQEA